MPRRLICVLALLVLIGPMAGSLLGAQGTQGRKPALEEAARLLQQGKLAGARKLCLEWLRSHPADAQATLLQGHIEFAMAAEVSRRGTPSQRVTAFRYALATLKRAHDLLSKQATDPVLDHRLGYCYFVVGEFEAAIRHLDGAIGAGNSTPDVLFLRGLCHIRADNVEAAEADLKRSVAADPLGLPANHEYANLLADLGRLQDANRILWDLYGRLGEEAPLGDRNATLFKIYANALAGNDFDGAIKPLELSLKLDPDNHRTRLELGGLYYRKGEFDKATEKLDRVLSAGTSVPKADLGAALRYRGLLALHHKDHRTARELFERSLSCIPNNAATLKNLAAALRRLGEREEALAVLDRFRAAFELEDRARRLSKQVQAKPRNRTFHIELIDTYLQLDWPDWARNQFEQFRAYLPDDPAAKELEERIRRAEARARGRAGATGERP